MRVPTLPELEKLPADQRESFFRRCDETVEMQRFRSRAQLFRQALVLCAAAIPILLGEFVFHWHMALSLCISIPLTFVAILGSMYLCIWWQTHIYRQLLIAELGGRRDA